MRSWRKIVAVATATLVLGALSACSATRDGGSSETTTTTQPAAQETTTQAEETTQETTETDADGDTIGSGELIGIAMPTRSLERWNNDGAHLEELLTAAGFTTSLQYADNKSADQISQLENMINDGAKVLVIAPVDSESLGPVLEKAAAAGIKVINYDRFIQGTPNVDYYATFDNGLVGKLQGEFIVSTLGLDKGETGPFNIEMFAGSPDDQNAGFFFRGAYDVLKPYLDSGVLTSPSGKVPTSADDWKTISIMSWNSQTAQSEMENRLNNFYPAGTKLDVVLSPNDSLAVGIAQALDGHGFTVGDNWPILTGQDGDVANVQNIIDGKQSMTVWKDTRALGDRVAIMVEQIITGQEVEVNDTSTYDNGVKVLPTYQILPEVVTKELVQPKLVDSGFIAADKLTGL
jgi:putative multiple sugar transport system substrate-binding protein